MDDDEEKVKPPVGIEFPPTRLRSPTPEPETPVPAPPQANELPNQQVLDDRRVKLIVTMAGQDTMTIVVKPSAISKIASLAPQLITPQSGLVQQRQSINCSTLSGEEAVIQAIEFLESGALAPIATTADTAELLEQLCERIKLFDITQELDIVALEIAVIEDFLKHASPNAAMFAQFATACYDRAAGHRVEKSSSLGQLVKAGLSRLMPELIASGTADDLRKVGGPLAEEIVDVVWNRHIKLEQQRVARMVADRDLVE